MIYLLTLDNANQIDIAGLEKNLNLALDWVQIMPNVFIIKSDRSKEIWQIRIRSVSGDNLFFIIEISLNNNYNGWLHPSTWEWINGNKGLGLKIRK
jgi:hypothetical protein